jgi:hypothetical protein
MTDRRKLVYVPEINPDTFLFFFTRGNSGRSYCLRDYSRIGKLKEDYADKFTYTDQDILTMARYKLDAPILDTHDLNSWRQIIEDANRRYLRHQLTETSPASPPKPPVVETPHSSHPQPAFPILDLETLLAHPIKGAKAQDMERIFSSPMSEDYVTWNMMRLLQLTDACLWWPKLLALARKENPSSIFPGMENEFPELDVWQKCLSPQEYERLSRERMAHSNNPSLVARSKNASPVEGETEVDLVIRGRSYLIHVEAKLESDVSMKTTYDPDRNQIIRNVDVLLEESNHRVPIFWMFVKDKGSARAYTQLTDLYRTDPETLAVALPHRDPSVLWVIAQRITLLEWCDLLALLPEGDSAVCEELKRRVKSSRSL